MFWKNVVNTYSASSVSIPTMITRVATDGELNRGVDLGKAGWENAIE